MPLVYRPIILFIYLFIYLISITKKYLKFNILSTLIVNDVMMMDHFVLC